MVFSMAYHFLRDRSAAEELAQEVFLELHLHRREIESAGHCRYWLRKVTSRRCIDAGRKRRVHVSLDAAPEPFVWMAAEDSMLKQYLGQLVQALPEAPRLVMILRYQEDLNPGEIADVLEMPLGTVKSHLQRSLALLRRKVEARGGGELR